MILVSGLLAIVTPSFSTAFAYDVIIIDQYTQPNEEAINSWMDDLFESQEIWIARNHFKYFNSLRKKGVSEVTINLLNEHLVKKITQEEKIKLLSFYSNLSLPLQGFIRVDNSLKELISTHDLRIIYHELFSTNYLNPTYSNVSRKMLEYYIRLWKLPSEQEQRLLDLIFHEAGMYHLPITPDLWRDLPADQKMMFIKDLTNLEIENTQKAVKVEIRIKSEEDIQAVSRKYSGGGNAKAVVRLLRIKLAKSVTGEIVIPLESILPPFIRKRVGSYGTVSGPSCYNSGICVNRGNRFQVEYNSVSELNNVISNEYVKVPRLGSFRTGDLILFYSVSPKNAIHVATYIDEEIVFTKNGINKFNPYIFQRREDVESAYPSHRKVRHYRPSNATIKGWCLKDVFLNLFNALR